MVEGGNASEVGFASGMEAWREAVCGGKREVGQTWGSRRGESGWEEGRSRNGTAAGYDVRTAGGLQVRSRGCRAQVADCRSEVAAKTKTASTRRATASFGHELPPSYLPALRKRRMRGTVPRQSGDRSGQNLRRVCRCVTHISIFTYILRLWCPYFTPGLMNATEDVPTMSPIYALAGKPQSRAGPISKL